MMVLVLEAVININENWKYRSNQITKHVIQKNCLL